MMSGYLILWADLSTLMVPLQLHWRGVWGRLRLHLEPQAHHIVSPNTHQGSCDPTV